MAEKEGMIVATSSQNSPEILCEEILAEARRKSSEILNRGRLEAKKRLDEAAVDADRVRKERQDRARDEATRRSELILATLPVEAGKIHSAQAEALLESLREEISRGLAGHEGFDYSEALIALGTEAVSHMAGDSFTLELSPADRAALGDRLAEAITRVVGRPALRLTISDGLSSNGAGLVVKDSEGRQIWDNRFAARLERLWPELRRQLAVQTGLAGSSETTGAGA